MPRGARMSVRSETELLRKVPLFAGVDAVQLQVLVFSAERLHVAPQDVLFAAGSLVGAGHLVLQGQAEVLKPKPGEERASEPVALVGPGAFVGELAMIANHPASITVRASTDLQVLCIGHDLFLRVCGEFPEIGAKVLEALGQRLDTSLEDLRQAQGYFDRARPFRRS
jgi:CRP/FNR family transcriptional regulator, cyclic AMP receptor protein